MLAVLVGGSTGADWLRTNGRWQLVVVLAVYLVGVWVTNRAYVTEPARRGVLNDLDAEWAHLQLYNVPGGSTNVVPLESLLRNGYLAVKHRSPDDEARPGFWARTVHAVDLAEVQNARSYLHEVQQLRRRDEPRDHVAIARLDSARLHTQAPAWKSAQRQADAAAVASQIDATLKGLDKEGGEAIATPTDSPTVQSRRAELALLVIESLHLIQDNDDETLNRNAEAQTRAMWMVYAGIGVVLLTGLNSHRTTLLFGGLGGFLAPVMAARRRPPDPADYRSSWEVLMLGPIAGALAAFGGLLLFEFLSSSQVGLLGKLFHDNAWNHPTTAVAKALALLLGYSVTLFSFLTTSAIKAIEQPDAGGGAGAPAAAPVVVAGPAAPPAAQPPAAVPAGPVPLVATPVAGAAYEAPTVGENDGGAGGGSVVATLAPGYSVEDLVSSDVAPDGADGDCDGADDPPDRPHEGARPAGLAGPDDAAGPRGGD